MGHIALDLSQRITYQPDPERGQQMNQEQKMRGELRELLSQALVIAAAALRDKDQALENYELGKAAGFRAALALIDQGE